MSADGEISSLTERGATAAREAVGLLRATARGDEEAAAFVTSNLAEPAH